MAHLEFSRLPERAFVARRQEQWQELDLLLRRAHTKGMGTLSKNEIARLPTLYREVCADLARAQTARYSAVTTEFLSGLAGEAHAALYGARPKGSPLVRGYRELMELAGAFPVAVRSHRRAIGLASALFFLPLAAGFFASLHDPAFAYRFIPESQLRPLAEAYAHGFGSGRSFGADVGMAGFYVYNNVGIALRCFASGLFFGIGSAFFLLQNGLAIGATLGHVAAKGAGAHLLTFIIGHGSFELSAIVIAGGAGLSLGWSLVSPGHLTRIAALQARARNVTTLVFGSAAMLLLAAAIEAFWSASGLPAPAKIAFGLLSLLSLGAYLVWGGRSADEAAR